MTRIKICGNTNLENAKLAVDCGADYLGFIFVPSSKRAVTPEQARAIMDGLGGFTNTVGVFVNRPKNDVEKIAAALGLKYLQFHGEETALYCDHFTRQGYEVIKTFRVKDAMSLKRIDEYNVGAFLFDSYAPSERGGTGQIFDWGIIEDKPYVHEKLFLAGGLNASNVANAIRTVQPFAVDVASGVESSPGLKDPQQLRQFISIVRNLA
ncbi:MAG: N-(5'-phosphoribosyl)anthranilate isomerase [Candidatus Omnitrophica bacterium ADurb.Bin277]|nr:MAG: N-(5'-phosphoribosyl)anthranilate isomerase [Candidatus Omnitrophica bacterium ADurb.Bin277]